MPALGFHRPSRGREAALCHCDAGKRLRWSPELGGSLTVLGVLRLNTNPAFSVRANVSGNTQSAGVALIHRTVAVPPFWRALSKPAAPRTTMGDAVTKRNEHNGGRSCPLGLRSQRLYQLQHADDLVMRSFNHSTWQRGLVTRADRR